MRCDKFAFASHSHRDFGKSSHSHRIRIVKISFAFSHFRIRTMRICAKFSLKLKYFRTIIPVWTFNFLLEQLKLLKTKAVFLDFHPKLTVHFNRGSTRANQAVSCAVIPNLCYFSRRFICESTWNLILNSTAVRPEPTRRSFSRFILI